MFPTYDVVVAGGGPAGAATALRLARAGYTVALLERSRFEHPRVGETLAPSIQPLLRSLGLWPPFVAAGHLPSWGTRSVWSGAADHSHLLSGYGCGWHVDRRAFDRMLFDAAAAAGASTYLGTSLTSCTYDGRWKLVCSNGSHLSARVLIDATGRSATIGRSLGARRISFDRLIAITAQWPDVDVSHEQYLLIEATANGWWYTAPLPDNALIATLFTDPDLSRHHHLASPTRWLASLQTATSTATRLNQPLHAVLPAHTANPARLGALRVCSAASHRLIRPDDLRPWLAVGDAALAVDPVSGSGVPRALRTGEAAAETITRLLRRPADTAELITQYESYRNTECTAYLKTRAAYYNAAVPHPTAFWTRRTLTSPEVRDAAWDGR
jgi:flavin-dependent dehydrogenase